MSAVNRQIETIKRRREFTHLVRKGRRFHVSSWMVLNFYKRELGQPKFGWTLPRYVGSAVTRNRIKRWCREITREVVSEMSKLSSVDVNLVLKKHNKDFYKSMKHDEFKKLLRPALQRLIRVI